MPYEPPIVAPDGRKFVSIASDAVEMHQGNEQAMLIKLLATALFIRPDIEMVVACEEHGQHTITYHEPVMEQPLLNDPWFFSPN